MAFPTSSELIFSEQANHNFSKTLGELKRHTLSIHNRLQSILVDASFVSNVAEAYKLPLIANERCGSWYIPPEKKHGSAYFKSTDGHTGIWFFSTRRLNLHLLEIIGQNAGCIIVDSTRRGKRMPDALSKTVPIWCCVINRALFADQPEYHKLFTPPNSVSSSEHSQILARIPNHVESFLELQVELAPLRRHVTKPLRPMWTTPDSDLTNAFKGLTEYHPIVCCTSSRRVSGTEVSEGGYIQGSGDDTENWAFGLTPPVFWNNVARLLSTSDPELPDLISSLLLQEPSHLRQSLNLQKIAPTQNLFIASLVDVEHSCLESDVLIVKLLPDISESNTSQRPAPVMEVGIGPHKIGSKNLRAVLVQILSFVGVQLEKQPETISKVVIACTTGKDHSAGVALALLCRLYSDDGKPYAQEASRRIDKTFIRRRLGWIMTSIPDANPSRSTLQSVNSFLMERPD